MSRRHGGDGWAVRRRRSCETETTPEEASRARPVRCDDGGRQPMRRLPAIDGLGKKDRAPGIGRSGLQRRQQQQRQQQQQQQLGETR